MQTKPLVPTTRKHALQPEKQGYHGWNDRFEDLPVWQEGMILVTCVYRAFHGCSDAVLGERVKKVAITIPSNIAEGYERRSNEKFIRFLFITKGACAELRTQIYLAVNLGILEEEAGRELLEKTCGLSQMITQLIKFRKGQIH